MNLLEWAALYLKHRDVLERKLLGTETKGNTLLCTYKDKKVTCICGDLSPTALKTDGQLVLVCENTRKNLDMLIAQWDTFAARDKLTVIFVNLARNDKWLIMPKTHSMISEPDSIAQGLETLFANCNGKVEELPKKKKGMFAEMQDEEAED